jgi:hypothetical protein
MTISKSHKPTNKARNKDPRCGETDNMDNSQIHPRRNPHCIQAVDTGRTSRSYKEYNIILNKEIEI